ncbi:MAG: hypothetical protein Q4B80_06050 [Aerococcaceae bacterium]|nr:hypothetical protein [Aerococcaceae bacterium]
MANLDTLTIDVFARRLEEILENERNRIKTNAAVNIEVLDKLLTLAEKIEQLLVDETIIPRKWAGRLFELNRLLISEIETIQLPLSIPVKKTLYFSEKVSDIFGTRINVIECAKSDLEISFYLSQIDEFYLDICFSARMEKRMNKAAFDKLGTILAEVLIYLDERDTIARALMRYLFSLWEQVYTESEYTLKGSELRQAEVEFANKIVKIFGKE